MTFDSAGKDFSVSSIFSDNAFSGVDRVSDANQIDLGVVSRVIDATRGEWPNDKPLFVRLSCVDWVEGGLTLDDQVQVTGVLPDDRTIVVERFRDEIGDWRVCILSTFGTRVHAPWAIAVQRRLGERFDTSVEVMWTDDGIVLRLPDAMDALSIDDLVVANRILAHENVVDGYGHVSFRHPEHPDRRDTDRPLLRCFVDAAEQFRVNR